MAIEEDALDKGDPFTIPQDDEEGYEEAMALDMHALTQKLTGWFREDIRHVAAWRSHAREDYAFYSGDQWAEEDIAVLHEQQRPVMTFNRVAPLVNAVVGSEINNRRMVRYIPREVGDSAANEILTGAGE